MRGTMRKAQRGEHYESVQREYLEHEVRIKERRDRERERQRQERHRRGHYSPPPPVRGQYGGRDAHAKRDNDLRELRERQEADQALERSRDRYRSYHSAVSHRL